MKPQPELFLDDHRGTYIPRDFAKCVRRELVTGITDEQYAILEDPTHDYYWEVWDEVLDSAGITSDGTTYRLYQDGALWLIPEGMEWGTSMEHDDKEEWWVWPDDATPELFYVAHPDEVAEVTIVFRGLGEYNVKRSYTKPVRVRNVTDGDEFFVEESELFTDPIAASVRSAELARRLSE